MPTVRVQPIEASEPSEAPPPGLVLRLRVKWNKLKLDQALADGADPGESEELALRAQQLAETKKRRALADSLDDLLERAERSSEIRAISTRVPFNHDRIHARREQLGAVARWLREDPAPRLSALARVNLLLEDGTGPLYVGRERLEPAVEAILAGIRR